MAQFLHGRMGKVVGVAVSTKTNAVTANSSDACANAQMSQALLKHVKNK
jgi:hypothetical protein